MDLPSLGFDPSLSVLSTAGKECQVGATNLVVRFGSNVAGAWPADGRAIYVPVLVKQACQVVKMGILNGVQDTGFVVDIGIYDYWKGKMTSSGRTAQGAAGPQIFDVTDAILMPGVYYWTLFGDTDASSTETIFRATTTTVLAQACGMQQQAVGSGNSLPATATFAGGVVSNSYVPYIAAAVKTVF